MVVRALCLVRRKYWSRSVPAGFGWNWLIDTMMYAMISNTGGFGSVHDWGK